MVRKRPLDQKEIDNFAKCLAVPNVSGDACRKIWNVAGELRGSEAGEIGRGSLGHHVSARLAPAMECFEEHSLLSGEASERVWMADLQKVLTFLAASSPTWSSALSEAMRRSSTGVLQPVLYMDEVQGGNILHPDPLKKIACFYCSFLEMNGEAHREAAWLCVCVVQSRIVGKLAGQMSGLVKELLQTLHAEKNLRGWPIVLSGQPTWIRIAESSYFLSDADAMRQIFSIKGSAAVVPCPLCANVLKRGKKVDDSLFVDVTSHEPEKWICRDDDTIWSAADSLLSPMTKTALNTKEKATGLVKNEAGLLFDVTARKMLPFSKLSFDAFHIYLSDGIAAQEAKLLMDFLQEQGFTLEGLHDLALQSDWHMAQDIDKTVAFCLKQIFSEKLWGEHGWRGEGSQCWSMIFLLAYYAWRFLADRDAAANKLQSFMALQEVLSEMRFLKYLPEEIVSENQVARFRALQLKHHRLFCKAWGLHLCRPKHHARHHLPDHCLLLKRLPLCTVQEKRHQIFKGAGLLDNLKSNLKEADRVQKSLLPRVLLTTVDEAEKHGLSKVALEEPIPASLDYKRACFDENVQCAKKMYLGQRQVGVGNVLIFHDKAKRVLHLLQGPACGILIHAQQLAFERKEPWGAIFTATNDQHLWQPRDMKRVTVAAWWREEQGEIFATF